MKGHWGAKKERYLIGYKTIKQKKAEILHKFI